MTRPLTATLPAVPTLPRLQWPLARFLREGTFYLSIVLIFASPYFLPNVWWKFLLSTLGILFLFKIHRPKDYLRVLGLKLSKRDGAIALGLFLVVLASARGILLASASAAGYTYQTEHWSPGLRLMPVFQAVNEEIFFRAFFLNVLIQRFKRAKLVSIFSATAFMAIHPVYYAIRDGYALMPMTIMTLLFFGLAANQLFLTYRHIGFTYALHFGWNATRFGGEFTATGTGAVLKDGLSFDILEGSGMALGFALLILAASMVLEGVRNGKLLIRVPIPARPRRG